MGEVGRGVCICGHVVAAGGRICFGRWVEMLARSGQAWAGASKNSSTRFDAPLPGRRSTERAQSVYHLPTTLPTGLQGAQKQSHTLWLWDGACLPTCL